VSDPTSPTSGRARRGTDAVGVVLAAALIAWVLVSWMVSGGTPLGVVLLVAGSAFAFVAGRALGGRGPRAAVLAVVLVAGALAAWSGPDIMRDRPLGRPFGYDNATAAYFVQATAAAWMLTLRAQHAFAAIISSVLTAVFAFVPFLVGALTAEILVVAVLLVGALGRFGGQRQEQVMRLIAGTFASVLAATIVLGALYPVHEGGPAGFVRSALSDRRLALWHDSLRLIRREPLFGVGASRFDVVSEVARLDPDTSRAHNEYFQLAAESGAMAGVLLAALAVWLILRPGVLGAGNRAWALLASAACGAVAIHACVDYVLHTAAVPLTAAYLTGIATAGGRRRGWSHPMTSG